MAERYTYNPIAEHPIIPEYDDNEEKFKWNGALLNLSDLPVDEYTKTVYVVAGSSGSTDVKINKMTVSLDDSGSNYVVNVAMEYPSDVDITLTLSLSGGLDPIRINIPAGSTSVDYETTIPSSNPTPTLSNPVVDPVKDETYTFQVELPEPVMSRFTVYYGTYMQNRLDSLDVNEITDMERATIDADPTTLRFTIPQRDVEEISESELDLYKYALILALPKQVFDGDNFSFKEKTFQSDAEFVKKEDVTIGDLRYTVLYKTSDDVQYVARYGVDINYEYVLKYID